jgi:hypothetical protein
MLPLTSYRFLLTAPHTKELLKLSRGKELLGLCDGKELLKVPSAKELLKKEILKLEGTSSKKSELIFQKTLESIENVCKPLSLESYEKECGSKALEHLFFQYGFREMEFHYKKETLDQ